MNRLTIGTASLLTVVSITACICAGFEANDPDRESAFVASLAQSDLIVVANTEYVSGTEDESIYKLVNVRVLYSDSGQIKAESRPATSPKTRPTSVPANTDILVITHNALGPHSYGLCPSPVTQILFMVVAPMSEGQITDYREKCVKEAKKAMGKLFTPDVQREVEGTINSGIKGTELFSVGFAIIR